MRSGSSTPDGLLSLSIRPIARIHKEGFDLNEKGLRRDVRRVLKMFVHDREAEMSETGLQILRASEKIEELKKLKKLLGEQGWTTR